MTQKHIDKIYTKIVGVQFEGRQELLKRAMLANVMALTLRREPENPWDSYAVALDAELPNGEVVALGFIANGPRECKSCFKQVPPPKLGKPPVCPVCGAIGEESFTRSGLATDVAKAMDAGISYVCRVLQYTGGDSDGGGDKVDKWRGCNIFIEQLEISKEV